MKLDNFLNAVKLGCAAIALAVSTTGGAVAQEVTLRLHNFLPPPATASKFLKTWGEDIAEASEGRLVIQQFDAMALGGRPPQLMDQARDGVVDIALTVVGYTPGRFPRSEVFELPFMMTDPVATSLAFQQLVDEDLQSNEFQDVKVLGAFVHGPGVIHSSAGVSRLEDMQGLNLRGPTRIINDLLGELGATPVGMPVPAIPEALSKGVVDGTVIPWEVSPSIRLAELVDKHTEFSGDAALYTATIVVVMNKARYESLPEDLRAVLDELSGAALSRFAATEMAAADAPGRGIAEGRGNEITVLDEAEVARWKAASQPVVDRWVAEMDAKGIDGLELIDRARSLISQNSDG